MDTHKISAVSADAAADWDYLIQDGRIHRSVYTSEALFRREMHNIFARTWVFVGHESEIPAPGDFVTRHFGGRPVIITRDGDAGIHVLFNRCAHRGAKVCREDRGRCKVFVCPYHSWSYDHAGRSVSVPLDYAYDAERGSGKFDLVKVPRVSSPTAVSSSPASITNSRPWRITFPAPGKSSTNGWTATAAERWR